MASTPIDGALWRIAELGSRYSDPSWRGDRRRIWEALESAIAEAVTQLGDVSAALETAETQATEAEARTRSARRERDRLRARASALEAAVEEAGAAAQAHEGQLEAAREGALAEIRRARKERTEARVAVQHAEAALAEGRAAQDRAERERDEAVAERLKSEAERDRALIECEKALAERDAALEERDRALEERDKALLQRKRAVAERDEARGAKAAAVAERDRTRASLAKAEAERERARAAPSSENEVWETPWLEMSGTPAVIDEATAWGPTVDLREPADLPATSEVKAGEEPVGTETVVAPAERRRYLHVGATMGNLLPADLAPLLVPGASVLRREGRLAALIALSSATSEWAAPGSVACREQAQRLESEGFRVEWVSDTQLAS